MQKGKKIDLFPYLLLTPSIIMLLLITAYPFISSVGISFFDYSFLKQGIRFVGLKNYTDILSEGKFLSSVRFTLVWTVCNVALTTLLGFIMALLMRTKFWGREVLKATMLIPWILPQVVTGYVFNMMMAQDIGIITHVLHVAGIVPAGFSWFSDPRLAAVAVIIANSWRGFPFVGLMLYAKMQAMPLTHLEAAHIDGASAAQSFLYIILPYIKPVAVTSMLLTFIWTFNAFDIVKVMTNGGPLEATTTLSLRLQREAFDYMEISRACTMAVCMFLLLLAAAALFILISKLFIIRTRDRE